MNSAINTKGVVSVINTEAGSDGPAMVIYTFMGQRPFIQGCIVGLLHDITARKANGERYGFRDMSAELLIQLQTDCEAWLARPKAKDTAIMVDFAEPEPPSDDRDRVTGNYFWDVRQRGHIKGLPPIAVHLHEGKLHPREVGPRSDQVAEGTPRCL